MIRKIGVIYQDRNSLGFLRGLRDLLGCDAELIDPPAAIGNTQYLPARLTKGTWRYFKKMGVDMIVRFTDSDGDRWQKVRRNELDRVPPEASALWLCGVAVENVESWLAIDRRHFASTFGVNEDQLVDVDIRTGVVKRALARKVLSETGTADVVADFVRSLPRKVLRRWLTDPSLRAMFDDCRAAAKRADCPVSPVTE